MARCVRLRVSRRALRGVSLLESLVAVAVLAASAVAIADMERHLRLGGDIARERSEALRLGSDDIEQLRSFAAIDAASAGRSYASIDNDASIVDGTADRSGHAVYRIVRHVDAAATADAKAVSVTVQWSDRAGAPHDVVLHSFIAAAAPRYAGALALGAGAIDAAPRGAAGRAPLIPVTARNLGRGKSAWKPIEDGTTALVFDNASGDVVGRCDGVDRSTRTRDLSAADLEGCATGRWLLVSGTVRFTSATPPVPSQANEVPPATTLAVALGPGIYAAPPTCFSAAQKTVRYIVGSSLRFADVAVDATPASQGVERWDDAGARFLAWHCVVQPRADGRWSGRATLVAADWAIGAGGDSRRVCRFVGGGDAIDANIAHPADYRDVGSALVAQNFLVVRGSERCPPEATVQHQP
jgi:Tfp pilus assembly protein PilV